MPAVLLHSVKKKKSKLLLTKTNKTVKEIGNGKIMRNIRKHLFVLCICIVTFMTGNQFGIPEGLKRVKQFVKKKHFAFFLVRFLKIVNN